MFGGELSRQHETHYRLASGGTSSSRSSSSRSTRTSRRAAARRRATRSCGRRPSCCSPRRANLHFGFHFDVRNDDPKRMQQRHPHNRIECSAHGRRKTASCVYVYIYIYLYIYIIHTEYLLALATERNGRRDLVCLCAHAGRRRRCAPRARATSRPSSTPSSTRRRSSSSRAKARSLTSSSDCARCRRVTRYIASYDKPSESTARSTGGRARGGGLFVG